MAYIKPTWTRRNTSRGGAINESESNFEGVKLMVHGHIHYPGQLFVTAFLGSKLFLERRELGAKTIEAAEPEAEGVFKASLAYHIEKMTGLLEKL